MKVLEYEVTELHYQVTLIQKGNPNLHVRKRGRRTIMDNPTAVISSSIGRITLYEEDANREMDLDKVNITLILEDLSGEFLTAISRQRGFL